MEMGGAREARAPFWLCALIVLLCCLMLLLFLGIVVLCWAALGYVRYLIWSLWLRLAETSWNYLALGSSDASEGITSNVALSATIWITLSCEVRAYMLCVCVCVCVCVLVRKPPVAGWEPNLFCSGLSKNEQLYRNAQIQRCVVSKRKILKIEYSMQPKYLKHTHTHIALTLAWYSGRRRSIVKFKSFIHLL